MPGPKTSAEAIAWIREVIPAGRYVVSVHMRDRLRDRHLDMEDVFTAVDHATACERYVKGKAEHGGSCWRLIGPNVDGDQEIALGIEAYMDKKGRRCVLCTIFRPGED